MQRVSLEQKMAMKELLASDKTFKQIAKELDLKFEVVRKWCRVIKKGGSLSPTIGRPKTGPLSTFSKAVLAKIDEYRPSKEGWGADTIKVELDLETTLDGLNKPSAMSIHRYLKVNERVGQRRKLVPLITPPIVRTERPHQLWQLDAEGNCFVKDVGFISMINIKETHCKVYVEHYPCSLAGPHNHPTTIDYQTVLRLGMMKAGMPEGLQVDHESIYFDNVNASPFPTTYHLWLVGLGIKMHLTPKGKPYKQGSVERSHQTIRRQVLAGQAFDSWHDLYGRCEQRRERLNYHIPCSSLAKKAPLQACPKAAHSGRKYHPQRERKIFDIQRVYDYLAQGQWYRKISTGKVSWLGSRKYHLPNAKLKTQKQTMITFDKHAVSFLFHDADGNLIDKKPALGLTFKELAGNLNEFIKSVKTNPHL